MFPCCTYLFCSANYNNRNTMEDFCNIVRNEWGLKGKKIVMSRLMKITIMNSDKKKIFFSVYSKKYNILVLHFFKIAKPKQIKQLYACRNMHT